MGDISEMDPALLEKHPGAGEVADCKVEMQEFGKVAYLTLKSQWGNFFACLVAGCVVLDWLLDAGQVHCRWMWRCAVGRHRYFAAFLQSAQDWR